MPTSDYLYCIKGASFLKSLHASSAQHLIGPASLTFGKITPQIIALHRVNVAFLNTEDGRFMNTDYRFAFSVRLNFKKTVAQKTNADDFTFVFVEKLHQM